MLNTYWSFPCGWTFTTPKSRLKPRLMYSPCQSLSRRIHDSLEFVESHGDARHIGLDIENLARGW